MKEITIIGAGIGGLTAAIALQKQGYEVEIFEQAAAFKKAGSGINLAINAMQIYQRLGVYDDILARSSYTHSMSIRNKSFDYLVKGDLTEFEKKYGAKTVAIHRASLHEILLNHLKDTPIHLDKKLQKLQQINGTVKLYFEDGMEHISPIVIGADGIHSAVRTSIFDAAILRDGNQLCWRGICKAPELATTYKHELNEIWGKGNRFGFVYITDEDIYWYALKNKDKFKGKDENLLDVFSDYPAVVKAIISSTAKESILYNEIWDLHPIHQWHRGNVCLLGDAAHATTPNLGQGAVQAIESAYVLSHCLKQEGTIEQAFNRFQEMRKSKADHITNTSWRIGKMAQSENAIVCGLRNFMTKMTPVSIANKMNEFIYRLNY